MAAVEEALSDVVCTTLPETDIEACIEFVYENWPMMGKAIFAWPDTYTELCAYLGYCRKTNVKVKYYRIKLKFS